MSRAKTVAVSLTALVDGLGSATRRGLETLVVLLLGMILLATKAHAQLPVIISATPTCGARCLAEQWVVTWPLRGAFRISSRFGRRRHPLRQSVIQHKGVDLAAPSGTPILALSTGRIVFAGWRAGYGRTVEIEHGNGWMSRYAHARRLLVRRAQTVEQGQVIAEVGATGDATGAHLHFEVWKDGRAINPLSLYPDVEMRASNRL